jgi:pilus assembly protein CpaB
MKSARIFVLAIALAAGLAAAMLAGTSKPPTVVVQQPPPLVPTDGVLAAANELFRGDVLTEANMRWDEWPAEKIPAGVIRKSTSPSAIAELKGAKLRAGCATGEPLRRERIALGQHSGFIASDLPPGKRAVAINIDAQGSSTAGGFILPADTVDVIQISKALEDHFIRISQNEPLAQKIPGEHDFSRTILRNVRVLAIGQNIQVNNGDRAVTGSINATLEVTPEEAETILLAQRTGTLTLTRRSMADANVEGEKKKRLAEDLRAARGGGAQQSKGH